jgi:protein-S-isoprenylcysteine O-methyltransferase Ste14
LIPVFIVYITKKQIYFEEISLEKKFGQNFLKYSDRVRRWI